jgi:hypothetical protein
MAIACPVDLDTLKLRAEIQSMYARVAAAPSGELHFHRSSTRFPSWTLAQFPKSKTSSPRLTACSDLRRTRPSRSRDEGSAALPYGACTWFRIVEEAAACHGNE